jgi:hypothetical protein
VIRSTKLFLQSAAVVAALIAACNSSSPASPSFANSDVASVEVTLDAAVVTVGGQAHATARVLDRAGTALSRSVVWTSSNSAIASVSSSGIVSGATAGTIQITATVDGKGGSAPLTVVAVGAAALSGTVKDVSGGGIAGGTVEVVSGNTQIDAAPVSASGSFSLATLAAGTYTVRLHPPITHSLGPSEPDTRTVTVAAGQGAAVAFTVQPALYSDNFQSYTSSSQLNSGSVAPGNFWAGANHDIGGVSNPQSISLDPTGGFNGDKAMRYDWPSRATAACTGSEITTAVMPRLNPPPAGLKDLWIRFTTKESAGFAHGLPGCGGRSYKFFLVNVERGSTMGRAGTYLGDGAPASHLSTRLYMDLNSPGVALNSGTLLPMGGDQGWGGQYHTWVIELTGIGTSSSVFTTYLDGKKIGTVSGAFLAGQTLGAGWNIMFEMGANMNNGPDHAQSRWWREFGVYTTRPSLLP